MVVKDEEETRTVSVRMPMELYNKVQLISKKKTRSISQQIIHYIKQELENCENIKVAELLPPKKPPPDQEGDAVKQAEGQ